MREDSNKSKDGIPLSAEKFCVSSVMRCRCCSGLNFLNDRPVFPDAVISASDNNFFGSGRLSHSFLGGNIKFMVPFLFPAAARIAPSSENNHASIMRIGINGTYFGLRFGHAKSISSSLELYVCVSPSLCINIISHGNCSSAARILLLKSRPTFPNFANCGCTPRSGACCFINQSTMGMSALSEVPSARSVYLMIDMGDASFRGQDHVDA